MPFPLAHPVLVLPFRKLCPERLSMVGLVLGSIVPDLGYAIREFNWSDFTHSVVGSFVFCLPVGLVAAYVVFAIRRPLAGKLPNPHRQLLAPLCVNGVPPWRRLALSLLIGAWSHIALDALTHESALLAESRPGLRGAFSEVERRGLEIYHALWIFVSSFCLGLLGLLYLRFLKRSTGSFRLVAPGEYGRTLVWSGLFVVPYLVVVPFAYHMLEPGGFRIDRYALYGSLQSYLMLLTFELISLGWILRLRERKRHQTTVPAATKSSDNPAPSG